MSRFATSLGTALVVMAMIFPSSSAAQTTTDVTFKVAVQIPGAMLDPGVYHFAVSRDRKTVSVADANRRIVTTVRVVEVSRAQKGPLVTMRPKAAGAPPQVAALFPTGSSRGVEFVYSGGKE